MNSQMKVFIRVWAIAVTLATIPLRGRAEPDDLGPGNRGAVFTMDNSSIANHVLAFQRSNDGTLGDPTTFSTGGKGTGSGLGTQGAIVLSENSRWLFACNAGSDEISVFLVTPDGPVLT